MALVDDLPNTKQGLITFRTYAEKQIKDLYLAIGRLEKLLEECNKRLEKRKDAK